MKRKQSRKMSKPEKVKVREHLSGLADAARKFAAEEASNRPAWGNWRKPTPRELELFQLWWKLKYGYEPRAHEIAGFDPDWTVLRAGYEGTDQEPPIPNLEQEIAMMRTPPTSKIQ